MKKGDTVMVSDGAVLYISKIKLKEIRKDPGGGVVL
jgi:hypothetical protein